jgi:hypothetical protein
MTPLRLEPPDLVGAGCPVASRPIEFPAERRHTGLDDRSSISNQHDQMGTREEREETIEVLDARRLRKEPSLSLDPQEGDQPVTEALMEPAYEVVIEHAPHRVPALVYFACVSDEVIRGLQEEVLSDGSTCRGALRVQAEQVP